MDIKEFLKYLNENGFSDISISNKTDDIGAKISRTQVYLLRTGRSENPKPATCKALADAFGYDLKYVHGEPQFYKTKSEVSPSFQVLPADTSLPPIPVIAIGEAGANGITLEVQLNRLPIEYKSQIQDGKYFEGDGEYFVTRPVDVKDITAYAVKVEGDSMSPLLDPGSIVVASPIKTAVSGDLCVIKLKSNSTYIKKVYFQEDGYVILKSFNPNYPDKYKPRDDVEFCHKVVWIKV